MGLLSLFKKRPKPNLTPDISYRSPESISPEIYRGLKDRAMTGINAGQMDLKDALDNVPGIGLGKDFDSLTNPAVQSRLTGLREQEIPEIASANSARGLGRSTIATDQIGKAARNAQLDINQLIANFELINRQQAKQDISERTGLGDTLLERDRQQANQQAAASERLANATAAQQINRDNAVREDLNSVESGIFAAIPSLSGGSSGISSILQRVMQPKQPTSTGSYDPTSGGSQYNIQGVEDLKLRGIINRLRGGF